MLQLGTELELGNAAATRRPEQRRIPEIDSAKRPGGRDVSRSFLSRQDGERLKKLEEVGGKIMKLEEHENDAVKIRSHFSKTVFFVYSIGILTVLLAKLKGISSLLSIISMCWYWVILNESWFLYFYMKQKNVTRWVFCDLSQIEGNNALIVIRIVLLAKSIEFIRSPFNTFLFISLAIIFLMINFNIASLLGLYGYLNTVSKSAFMEQYRHILLIKSRNLKRIAISMPFYLVAMIFVLNENNFIVVRVISGVISGLILLVIMCLLVDSVKSLIHSNYEGADEDDSKI